MLQLLKGFIIANTRPGFRSCIDQVIRCSPRWFKSILSTLHWPCGMLHPVVISDSSIQHQETASRFTARWQRKRHCNGPECARMKVKTETSTIVWKTWYVFPLLNLDSKCPCCWSKYMYHKQHSFLPSQVVLPVWITKPWRNLDDNDPKVVDLRKIHQKSVTNLFASRVGVNFQTVNFFLLLIFLTKMGHIEEMWSNISFDFKQDKVVGKKAGKTNLVKISECSTCINGSTKFDALSNLSPWRFHRGHWKI